jgi:hypothetical protein
MAIVDDLEEDIGRVGAVAEIADLIDHEHVGVRIARHDVAALPAMRGGGQLVDERRRGGEGGIEDDGRLPRP